MLDDMSRCTGQDCPFKDSCERYMTTLNDKQGVYSYIHPPEKVKKGKECSYYIPHIKYVCNPPKKRSRDA